MSIDFSTKEGRKKYLTEKLDDLIEGINESYGSRLVEELLDRLEFTIEEFNNQMNDLHKDLVDREKERRQMLDMIKDDSSPAITNIPVSETEDKDIASSNILAEDLEPELTEWELRLKDLNGKNQKEENSNEK